MGRPKKGYFLEDGTRVPSVTTILSRFKDAGGLIHWAWNLGIEGKDYREVRDTAASIGTAAHDMVDCHIHGREFDASQYSPDIVAKAEVSYRSFLEWASASQLKTAETETPMVSELYRYGGTPDVFFVKGKRSLGDWKSSNSIYVDYLYQLAAYRNLWEENHPDEPIEGGAHLIRFDKTYGDFHHHYYSDLDEAWEGFVLMRRLYDIDKNLKKRVQ